MARTMNINNPPPQNTEDANLIASTDLVVTNVPFPIHSRTSSTQEPQNAVNDGDPHARQIFDTNVAHKKPSHQERTASLTSLATSAVTSSGLSAVVPSPSPASASRDPVASSAATSKDLLASSAATAPKDRMPEVVLPHAYHRLIDVVPATSLLRMLVARVKTQGQSSEQLHVSKPPAPPPAQPR